MPDKVRQRNKALNMFVFTPALLFIGATGEIIQAAITTLE